MDPYGGKMDEIEENETPFPHRKGNLFNIVNLNRWGEGEGEKKHLEWSREGFRKRANGAIGWGEKYFNGNFERLAKVKKMVDQDHFFGDMQSIPPIS
ncbi:hypothetical protein SASPL_113979 [Salvia splendens]|uniref:Berberine/berberine-like domain-containing protein n=1 Tax=Salvia splendens TaxID=180675 RepID=A0A8X8Y0G8_SALSN|nr:hypothetical protein SASPL_113979 [Salvia splendens]